MKKLYFHLSAFLLTFSMVGSAQAVLLKDLIDNQGSIIAGDKRFDSFWWNSEVSNSSFDNYDFDNLLNTINVTGIDDGGDFGLEFTTDSLSVTSTGFYEWVDLFFGFKVTALDPDLGINGVSLSLGETIVVEGGDNGAFIIEKIGTSLNAVNDPVVDGNLANLTTELSWLDGTGLISDISDSTGLSLQQEIYISKNIFVWADAFGSGSDSITATLNSFDQRFSKTPHDIPEPGIWMLLVIGMIGLVFNIKRHKFTGKI